jgi:predicted regulator of amino acid metabolism with ACT domain
MLDKPKRKPARSRTRRKLVRPTKLQRHQVEVAVSIGLTVEQIATAIEMSRRSVYSHFRDELATGRVKRLLANAMRLDDMAAAGNVSAAKYLHTLMLDHPEPEADDRWANVAESISAAQNPEFGKMN